MKNLTLIIPLLSALTQAAEFPEESASAIIPNGTNQFIRPIDRQTNSPVSTTINHTSFYQPERTNLPTLITPSNRNRISAEQLLNKTLPKVFKARDGTAQNFTDLVKGDEPSSMELKSDWIAPYLFYGNHLHGIRIRINKNPETDNYEISGGSMSIPFTRFEAGYETEPGTEEQKATLQWKISF